MEELDLRTKGYREEKCPKPDVGVEVITVDHVVVLPDQ